MSIPENFKNLAGDWRGTNRLHTVWIEDDPLKESDSEATVKTVAGKGFLQIEYDWVFEGEKQNGILIFGGNKDSETVNAVWIDSWHQSDAFMSCEGKAKNRLVSFKGFYKVLDHPEWAWRTDIKIESENSFQIIMYNISPEKEEHLAVEMFFDRK